MLVAARMSAHLRACREATLTIRRSGLQPPGTGFFPAPAKPALLAEQKTCPRRPGAALGRGASAAVPARPPDGKGSPSGRERRGRNRRRSP